MQREGASMRYTWDLVARSWKGAPKNPSPPSGSRTAQTCHSRREQHSRETVVVVRDFMEQTKVDPQVEMRFKQLPFMDMYMVARRGCFSGTNRAAELESRANFVRAYHNCPESLSPGTYSDLHRYCAEFVKYEAGVGPREYL